jgi:hypothetical protein
MQQEELEVGFPVDRLLPPIEATRRFLFTLTEHAVYMFYVFMDARDQD